MPTIIRENTRTAAEDEADQLLNDLEAELANARAAPEPGSFTGKVISRTLDDEDGDGPVPLPVREASVTSAGYTVLYDTESFEPIITNNNMRRAQLAKLRPDGRPRFTTRKPKQAPFRGTFKCLLHPDSPERERWQRFGFKPCPKENMTSLYGVEVHMLHRHKLEWGAIQRDNERVKEEEEREFRRAQLTIQTQLASLQIPRATADAADDELPGDVVQPTRRGRPPGRSSAT